MRYFFGVSGEEYKNYQNICFCHNDLFLLKDTLVNFCDYSEENMNINMLYVDAEEGKSDYLYSRLENICKKADEDDTIIFYFAGHGLAIEEDVFLVLPDTVPNDEKKTALSLSKVNNILKNASCSCFGIIDACHSGVYTRGHICTDFIEGIGNIQDHSWAILASCSEKEYSFPDPDLEQGIFTYCVSEAIKRWEKETKITMEQLKIVVASLMAEWCEKKGLIQHPTLNGLIVGIQDLAIRNNEITEYDIIVYEKVKEEGNVENEIQMVHTQPTELWTTTSGIRLPKKGEIGNVLAFSVQLRQREVQGIYRLYAEEQYEFASETIWERSIMILRGRVLSLGIEFVAEMVGIDNLSYVIELPAFEVINIATDLGFINSTGKMKLTHANELVQHYKERDVEEEMSQTESDFVIRACVQYILGYDNSEIKIEYGDFRTSLKQELFEKNTERLDLLSSSPYFYKKTTIRTLINLLASTEGAEFETVASNFVVIVECVWKTLSSEDRYFIGTTYSKYANRGEEKYIITFKKALGRVHGFDYVPENLRSSSFIKVAKEIKAIHYSYNNFYKEPGAVVALEKMGLQIPKPAIHECVSACLMVLMGNFYGRSRDAVDVTYGVLDKLDRASWNYYVNECLAFDEPVLIKIHAGDGRTNYWCDIVIKYHLNGLDIKEKRISELLENSFKRKKNSVSAIAGQYLKHLGNKEI